MLHCFSLLNIAQGFSLTITGNILGTFSRQSRTPVMKLFPNKYKIENTVEATLPSSYSSLFYIQLSNT